MIECVQLSNALGAAMLLLQCKGSTASDVLLNAPVLEVDMAQRTQANHSEELTSFDPD